MKFKDRKYVPEPVSKAIPDPLTIHQAEQLVFMEIYDNEGRHYFFNYQTNKSQYEAPPAGAVIHRIDGTQYVQQSQE